MNPQFIGLCNANVTSLRLSGWLCSVRSLRACSQCERRATFRRSEGVRHLCRGATVTSAFRPFPP